LPVREPHRGRLSLKSASPKFALLTDRADIVLHDRAQTKP